MLQSASDQLFYPPAALHYFQFINTEKPLEAITSSFPIFSSTNVPISGTINLFYNQQIGLRLDNRVDMVL